MVAVPMDPGAGLWWIYGLCGLALVVSGVILAALYVWATIFRNTQLTAYVKQETYEMIVTVIMVPILLGTITAADSVKVSNFFPPNEIPQNIISPDDNLYQATLKYYEKVSSDIGNWLVIDYIAIMYADAWASRTISTRPMGVGFVTSPYAGLASPAKQLLYHMASALSVSYFINEAFLRIGGFAIYGLPRYYLPVGIFLRCFTPTRRLGGAIIGLTVAFLLAFPALSVIDLVMFYNQHGPMLTTSGSMIQYVKDLITGAAFRDYLSHNFVSQNITDFILSPIGAVGQMIQDVFGSAFLGLVLVPMSSIAMAFLIAFVAPTITLFLVTQIAKDVSKSFGEEIDISSITRVI
jgi:hypothetical protein